MYDKLQVLIKEDAKGEVRDNAMHEKRKLEFYEEDVERLIEDNDPLFPN